MIIILIWSLYKIFVRSLWGSVQPPKVVPRHMTHPVGPVGWDGPFFAVDVSVEKHFGNFVAYNTQRLAVSWHNLTVPKEDVLLL